MHALRLALTALALAVAMLLAERVGRRERIGAVILVLLSFAWLTADKDWEFGVLLPITHSHGLATSDLLGLAGLARGAWQLWRSRRPAG